MARGAPAWSRSLILILLGTCLGLLLQVQWPSPDASAESSEYEEVQVQEAIERLENEQLGLKEAIGALRSQLERYQELAASETETLRELRDELTAQRTRAGLLSLKGPGTVVSLDDSQTAAGAGEKSLDPYIVHEYDVRDVINLLWLAGAEAVAVNDERIVASTSIYCVGSTIMVNDTRLSPPYLVRAIGDPSDLYDVVRDPTYLADLRRRVEQYGVQLTVDWGTEVVVPAYEGTFAFEYAKTGGS